MLTYTKKYKQRTRFKDKLLIKIFGFITLANIVLNLIIALIALILYMLIDVIILKILESPRKSALVVVKYVEKELNEK